MQRIDKILASQNLGSRKQVSSLIKDGVVKINGKVCNSKDTKADPDNDTITVGDNILDFKQYVYIMMNKPGGVLSASNDKNAKTVIDLLPPELYRKGLFPAGRLDKDTEGLLIITDDGDFAHKMLSPKKKVYKHYIARLDKEIEDTVLTNFKTGISFADGTLCLPAEIEICSDDKKTALVKICEGKFHQVKKMFLTQGLTVEYLQRICIGSLKLDENLIKGESRYLSATEKQQIFENL